MTYQGPPWAAIPADKTWKLVEIKDGVTVASYHLSDRPYTLLGRDADQAHIGLSHASCSRLHARIAFDAETGTPWLRDLQSTHGSMVNKKPVPTASVGTTESMSTKPGSRGVVLYPNDILQFGASTRLYILEGPEAFARNNKNNKPALPTKQSTNTSSSVAPNKNPLAVANNNDDDNDLDVDEQGNFIMKLPAHLDESDIATPLRKEWNAWRALQYRWQHLRDESERIQRKGGADTLTAGQERQLLLNQERMDHLQAEMQTKEAALFRKLYPEKVQRAKQRQAEKLAYMDDDEVLDQTRDTSKRSIVNQEETEASLLKKREVLVQQWKQVSAMIRTQAEKCGRLEREIQGMKARGDEEAFFVQNDLDMANDTLQKEKNDLREVDSQMDEVDELLRVVNPKLKLEKPFDEPDPPPKHLNDGVFAVPAPKSRSITSTATAKNDTDEFVMPAPVLPPSAQKKETAVRQTSTEESLSPPKRRRVQGAAMPPPSFSVPSQKSTAASISSLLQQSTRSLSSSQYPESDKTATTKTTSSAPVVNAEDKHDKWQPPKDQDGSGYTKLNARFAGRY